VDHKISLHSKRLALIVKKCLDVPETPKKGLIYEMDIKKDKEGYEVHFSPEKQTD